MAHASGTFEVKLTPQAAGEGASGVGRMTINKRFSGDLEATSRGEMLTLMTPVEGSAGYVAMEQVTGTIAGRSGTFALQHTGTMRRGAQRLSVTVVPDSGTGQLAGLAGEMKIDIVGGKHLYTFDYTLDAAAR
ncbi:MAG TPA: DUF3224 domain-containing protein [Pyrinomonadaceae bacterium]|jgi:hypothetical protein